MKIIVVGGTGELGRAVVENLIPDHDIIIASRTKGDLQVDISDEKSIENLYQTVGKFDAVISTAGTVHFTPLTEFTNDGYQIGLQNKLMGQVNLVLIGMRYINEKGSFTLTSGILSHDPISKGSSASMVNGALDSFVKAAAIELPKGLRINVVSPTLLTESAEKYKDYFSGFEPVSAARAALAFRKSVEGAQTGQVYSVGW